MKFKNRMKRAATGLLALAMAVTTLLGSTGLTAYAADTEPNPQPPANGERIFSVDPFDSDHSAGYFCVKDTVGNGDVAYNDGEDGEWSGWRGTNGSKSNKIYFDHHNGACFNGTYFDIREYVWQEDCEYYAIRNNGSVAARGTEDGRVFREFHFYESGNLDSGNPVEVEWKGVMRLTDMDIEEGYSFIQGLHAAWLNNPTNVTKRDKVTWRGTWENNNDGVNSEHEMLWVEVEGSPSKPLTIAYWVNKVHASGINYFGNTIKYELVPDGKDDLPPDAKPAVGVHCATYAKYDLMPEDEFVRYEFDGWYYDKGLTKKVPDTIMVAEDHTFYGTYHKVAGLITTEVVNGTITDGNECVPYGTDYNVDYAPNDGYLLDTVTVDGKQVDINTCPANYDFTNVQSDHHIKVVYANAEMDKSVSMKESETIENYPENADIDGDVIRDGDVVSYTIAYENPTSAARNILISDNVPAGVSVVDGSISDGGVRTDGKIIWSVQAEPYTKGTVSFDAKMSEDAEGSVVKNTAVVTLQPLTEDGSEKAVTLEDTVGSPILPDPSKSVANENGEDITNQIVNNGSVIMYQITFENPADTEKVFSIKDTVPAEVTYLDGSASDGGQYKDGAISWKLTLAAHETKTVTFNVKVNDPEAAYTHVFNQAEVAVDGTKKDTDSPVHTLPEDPARTPVYVLDDPVKAVLNVDGKNIGTDGNGNMIQTVKQAGDTLFYTVSFGNPADDERTFTITDTLPDGVKFISATDGSSYDEANRTVTWTVNVPATTQASVAVRVEILKEAEDTILKNHATVSVDEAQKDTNEVQTPVIPTPKKDAVSEPGGPSINTFPVQIGENLFYTVTWKNPADIAKTAVITDKLPDGVKFVSADQEGVYSEADHTVTWNVITDAHTEGTVTVKVKVLASAAGTELNNQARVGMDEADITTVTDNGGDDDDTTTNFVAAKTVVNAEGTEIDKQVVAVDDLVTYHIPYQNHSKNTRTITITDVLPQDVTYVEASEGGNVQSIVHGQTVIWVLEAAPKTDGEVWVTVKVTKALKGQAFANSAMLEVKDQETGQTKKAVTNQVINYVLDDVVKEVLSENGRKNLEGEKVKGGRTLLYRVTFKNPATTERTFTVTDELPEGVTFVSAENEGTYDEAAKTITWTMNLASGKSQTVSFLVTVDKTADCDFIQNVAKVHVDETDADSNPVKVYVKGDKSTDPENQDPKDGTKPDDQKPDDTKPADDPKKDDTTPADTTKTDDSTPKDDGKQDNTPSDDKKTDDQKPVITPTTVDDKKDTTTPTQDSSKSDDGTKKTTVKDNSGSSDDSGKGQSTPGSDGKGQSTQTTAPKTGDESNVTLWVILMLAAACAAGGFGIFAATKRRRRR